MVSFTWIQSTSWLSIFFTIYVEGWIAKNWRLVLLFWFKTLKFRLVLLEHKLHMITFNYEFTTKLSAGENWKFYLFYFLRVENWFCLLSFKIWTLKLHMIFFIFFIFLFYFKKLITWLHSIMNLLRSWVLGKTERKCGNCNILILMEL